jgi:hypothetical protein
MRAAILSKKPSPATAIAIAALVVALAGVAVAAIPDSEGVIHGCYQKRSGALRVVESADDCRATERPLTFNQQGPRGATGPPGPPGAGANTRTLDRLTLTDGQSGVLFTHGAFTFTARCEMDEPVLDTTVNDSGRIVVSSSEADSAPNPLPGVEQQVLTVQSVHQVGSHRFNYASRAISYSAASGTEIGGVLYAAVNAFGRDATCAFGGHVVTRP